RLRVRPLHGRRAPVGDDARDGELARPQGLAEADEERHGDGLLVGAPGPRIRRSLHPTREPHRGIVPEAGMNVILIEPCFPANQREFARALHAAGATVIGIGERPKESLADELRTWLTHYEQIPSVVDEGALIDRVKWVQNRVW